MTERRAKGLVPVSEQADVDWQLAPSHEACQARGCEKANRSTRGETNYFLALRHSGGARAERPPRQRLSPGARFTAILIALMAALSIAGTGIGSEAAVSAPVGLLLFSQMFGPYGSLSLLVALMPW